jgi:hypothetical protein
MDEIDVLGTDVLGTRMTLLLRSHKSKQEAKRATISHGGLTSLDLAQIAGFRFVCPMAIGGHSE